MPPSAITVCALPSSDLQIRPTETPAFAASMAARSPAPTRPDHEDVRTYTLMRRHQRILKSVQIPIEQSRTYKSASPP